MIKTAIEVLMGFLKATAFKYAEWLMKLFGKQQALSLLVISGFVAAVAAFYTGVSILLGQLVISMPTGSIWQGFLYMIIPPVLSQCLTVVASFWVIKKTYEWATVTLNQIKA